MRNGKFFRGTACGLALGLAALIGTAHADDQDKDVKKVEKHRVVMVDKDGKRQVFEGDGPLMRRGFLGVGLTELTPELRTHFGVPDDHGVMVSKVEPGSPAEKAGIKVGDVMTSIDGQDVDAGWDVMVKVRRYDDGQQVPIEVWRNGKAQSFTVTIVEKERGELDLGPMMWKTGDGEPMVFQLRKGELLKGLPEKMELPDLKLRVTPREIELEKRLKELEKRLNELEKQLEKQKS